MDPYHLTRRRLTTSAPASVRTALIAAATALALLTAVVVTTGGLSAGAAHADPRDDKNRVDAEVARAAAILEGATERAQGAAQRLAAATAAMPAAEQRVASTRGEVAAAQAVAATAARKAAAAQQVVDAATSRYAAAAQRVEETRARVAEFATASYKGSGLVALNVVINGTSPMDMLDRIGYVDRVLDHERSAIDELTNSRRAAKQAQDEAGAAQRIAEQARREADAALGTARAAQAAAEAAAAEVATLAAERKDALAVAESERAASLAKYADAKAEAARVEAELRAWAARQKAARGSAGTPTLRSGARFLMPVQGWKSSDFGNRFDPYYGVWQLHAGADFAAGGGAPIYAAADGQVIRASWNGGYGNFTCVSHGRQNGADVSTCYAHQSQVFVSAGQRVRRGQVIGRVGTTGASTGNHLHFEVRLDGRPTQPLSWLPGCLC